MTTTESIKLTDVRFNRIYFPKGATFVEAGTWCAGTISTGVRKNGKYESLQFVINEDSNVGIDTKAKYNVQGYYQQGTRGKQFVVTNMKLLLDTESISGLKQALTLFMSELIAERMLEHFKTPEAVIKAFENEETEEFLKIQGVTKGKLEGYYKLFDEKISGQEAILKLTPLGFTPKHAKRIYAEYKNMDTIMEKLESSGMYDFYFEGLIGFEDADKVGRTMKVNTVDMKRIGALIVKYYRAPFQDECYFTYEQFNSFVVPYLANNCGAEVTPRLINLALNYLQIQRIFTEKNNKLGLSLTYHVESGVYKTIKQLNKKLPSEKVIPKEIIESEINTTPFKLSEEQMEAVRLACTNKISIISGNAGAGKSTTLGIVTKIFKKQGYEIEQVALSGKAALRIEETTGLPARTIHRMFNAIPTEPETPKPDVSNPYLNVEKYNYYIKKDVLILDEASMVGGIIMNNLLAIAANSKKIKHIIIVGDDAQLPPIGIGQVFTDLLYHGEVPKVRLTQVYRQASESGILASATMVRQNQNFIPKLDTFGKDFKHWEHANGEVWIAEFKEMLKRNDEDLLETQIIVPTNELATRVNIAVQKQLDVFSSNQFVSNYKGLKFTIYEGSKVILNENKYKTLQPDGEENGAPVYNGSIGIVTKIAEKFMVIDFAGIGEVGIVREDWNAIRLGYAITIHKSQGSGFKSVIVVLNGAVEAMCTTNMLYTAITRSKEECTLIARIEIIEHCVATSAADRQTWLPNFYKEENKNEK